MKVFCRIAALIMAPCILTAQLASPSGPSRELEFFRLQWELGKAFDQPARDEAMRRAVVETREREFVLNLNQFVQRWAVFASDYNSKHVFNMKAAKDLSNAFHALEKSDGWIAGKK